MNAKIEKENKKKKRKKKKKKVIDGLNLKQNKAIKDGNEW